MMPTPSPATQSQPVKPHLLDKFLVSLNGVDLDDVVRSGAPEDRSTIRNQGIWKLTSVALDSLLMSNAAKMLMGQDSLTLGAAAIGVFASGCLLQIDRTFGNWYYFDKGKSEISREGLMLGKSGDGLAYGVMIGTRLVIGVSKALLLGSVAAQIVFASEIRNFEEQSVATLNAPIIATVERTLSDSEKSLAAQAKQDADSERAIVRETESLRRLDLANTQQIGRRTASGEKREVTQQQLPAYETREAIAHDKAAHSAQALQTFQSQRPQLARQRIVSDPRYVQPQHGLLTDSNALLSATQGNILARGEMLLFDALLISIELWSVFGLLGARGTVFSCNLVRNYLVQRDAIARELVSTVNGHDQAANDIGLEHFGELNVAPDSKATLADSFGFVPPFIPPPRRGRGRPRKPRPNGGGDHV